MQGPRACSKRFCCVRSHFGFSQSSAFGGMILSIGFRCELAVVVLKKCLRCGIVDKHLDWLWLANYFVSFFVAVPYLRKNDVSMLSCIVLRGGGGVLLSILRPCADPLLSAESKSASFGSVGLGEVAYLFLLLSHIFVTFAFGLPASGATPSAASHRHHHWRKHTHQSHTHDSVPGSWQGRCDTGWC